MKICLKMNKNLSKNLSFNEAIKSMTAVRLGIDNIPSLEQVIVMKYLAVHFFQILRDALKVPLHVVSFFRSQNLNQEVGGASASDHMIIDDVAAIDLDDTYSRKFGVYNRDVFEYILNHMDYYKLIWEYEDELTPEGLPSPRWVHISFSTDPKKNKEKRTLFTKGGGRYVQFDRSKARMAV